MTFTQFAETLLRQDVVPNISTTFSGSGLFEKGTLVNGTTITVNIKNLANVTLPINKVDFYRGNTLLQSMPFVEGQSSYIYNYANVIKEDTAFKIVLTYSLNQTITNTGSFTFVYASYYGTTALSAVTNNDAANLISAFTKTVKNTKALTWNNITLNDARYCYAYPNSFGDLTSIKDANNFEYLGSYTKTTMMIDSTLYNVYVLTDPVTITGAKQVYA